MPIEPTENASFIGAIGEERIEQDACGQNYFSSLVYHFGGKLGSSQKKIWRNTDIYRFLKSKLGDFK